MTASRHIDPDHYLETEVGRVFTPERSAAAFEQAYAELSAALRAASAGSRLFVGDRGLRGRCPPHLLGEPMPKPLVNLDDLEFDDVEDNGYYTSRRARFSASIGARHLGYNLTELPPGKAQCPYHSHRAEEEMFLILEGEGELRFGNQRYPIRKHDVIACPTGGADLAHQIINTGNTTMRYLSLSNTAAVEVCEYPDSGKIGVFADTPGAPNLRGLHRAASAVDYYDGESTEPSPTDRQPETRRE